MHGGPVGVLGDAFAADRVGGEVIAIVEEVSDVVDMVSDTT